MELFYELLATLPKSTGTDAAISCITEIYGGFVPSSPVILISRPKTTGNCDCGSWCNRAPQSLPVDFGLPSISHSHAPVDLLLVIDTLDKRPLTAGIQSSAHEFLYFCHWHLAFKHSPLRIQCTEHLASPTTHYAHLLRKLTYS